MLASKFLPRRNIAVAIWLEGSVWGCTWMMLYLRLRKHQLSTSEPLTLASPFGTATANSLIKKEARKEWQGNKSIFTKSYALQIWKITPYSALSEIWISAFLLSTSNDWIRPSYTRTEIVYLAYLWKYSIFTYRIGLLFWVHKKKEANIYGLEVNIYDNNREEISIERKIKSSFALPHQKPSGSIVV